MEKGIKKSKIHDLIRLAGNFPFRPEWSCFVSQLLNTSGRRIIAGRRWTYSDMVAVWSLYHQSVGVYQICQCVFILPSITSLHMWLNNIEVRPGFLPNVFELLKGKVAGMAERDKFCVVSFDEMSLRVGLSYNLSEDSVEGFEDFGSLGKTSRLANHALVFMVRGLIGKWKQPLGYFLLRDTTTADKLQPLLEECLQKVKAIGLQPKVVVCDQDSSNVQLYSNLGVTEDDPFFVHEGVEIYCMHDPSHLLLNTRSNLEKYVFEVKEEDGSKKHIRWAHICDYYEHISQLQSFSFGSQQLTRGHFEPVLTGFSKMKVDQAAEVFSYSVAAGISLYSALGELPAEADYTANFVEIIDGLLDSCNSRYLKDTKMLRRPISENSAHKSFFDLCLSVLQSLTVLGAKNVLFVEGWLLAISCLSQLWQHMKDSTGTRFLFTNRLNQDVVENLFSTIRRKCGCRDNPSAKEFRCAFRMVTIVELKKPVVNVNFSRGSTKFISTLQRLTKNRVKRPFSSLSFANKTRQNHAICSISLDLPEENRLACIAGHIWRRIITSHELSSKCRACREVLLRPDAPLIDSAIAFVHHKAHGTSMSEFDCLMSPSEYFLAFCEVCEKVFCTEFDDVKMARNSISHLINTAIHNTREYKDMNLCSERIKARIVAIFVSVRIHIELKFKNRKLQDC